MTQPDAIRKLRQLKRSVIVTRMEWIWVALGGAIGAMARYGVSIALPVDPHGGMPWATLSVNMTGSLLLAIVGAVLLRGRDHGTLSLLIGTGFCGALTTFSTFAVEAVALFRAGYAATAGMYLAANVLACLLIVWAVFHWVGVPTGPAGGAP